MEGYPEHEKLSKVKDKSRIIGEFLDYYFLPKYYICITGHDDGCESLDDDDYNCNCTEPLISAHIVIEKELAEYFGIDLDKIEKEKQQMLEEFRIHLKKNE